MKLKLNLTTHNYLPFSRRKTYGFGHASVRVRGSVSDGKSETMKQPEIEVHGVEPADNDERGPYGTENPYSERLPVEIDGEIQAIPVTGVRKASYDYYGNVPDTVDIDEVFYEDGLHGQTVIDENEVVELYHDAGKWRLELFQDVGPEHDFLTIWERD